MPAPSSLWPGRQGSWIALSAAGIGVAVLVIKPAREALFARLHARSRDLYGRAVEDRKRAVFAEIQKLSGDDNTPLHVIQIGTAIVENASFYPTNAEITCVTTDVYRNSEIRKLEDNYPYVNIVYSSPEVMTSIRDRSVDVVVSVLSMCTVRDLEAAIEEIKRILKKDGRYYFLEHVADGEQTMRFVIQNQCRAWWRFLLYGCRANSNFSVILRASGFQSIQMDWLTTDKKRSSTRYSGDLLNYIIDGLLTYVLGSHISGVAIK